jgi:hypothetical protein
MFLSHQTVTMNKEKQYTHLHTDYSQETTKFSPPAYTLHKAHQTLVNKHIIAFHLCRWDALLTKYTKIRPIKFEVVPLTTVKSIQTLTPNYLKKQHVYAYSYYYYYYYYY